MSEKSVYCTKVQYALLAIFTRIIARCIFVVLFMGDRQIIWGGRYMNEASGFTNLEMIYEMYFSKVYNYVFYRLLNKEQTEDIVRTFH